MRPIGSLFDDLAVRWYFSALQSLNGRPVNGRIASRETALRCLDTIAQRAPNPALRDAAWRRMTREKLFPPKQQGA